MAWGLALTSLMAALVLGGDFGVASASGEPAVGNRILVTLEVEVLTSAEVVVAHLIEPGSEQETVSLSSTGDGIFRGAATVPKVDLVVVFEAVRGPNDSTLSSPATLTGLGLDPELFGDLTPPIAESVASEPTPGIGVPLLIAILSGVLSLALIGWWVWSGSEARQSDDEPLSDDPSVAVSVGVDSVSDPPEEPSGDSDGSVAED